MKLNKCIIVGFSIFCFADASLKLENKHRSSRKKLRESPAVHNNISIIGLIVPEAPEKEKNDGAHRDSHKQPKLEDKTNDDRVGSKLDKLAKSGIGHIAEIKHKGKQDIAIRLGGLPANRLDEESSSSSSDTTDSSSHSTTNISLPIIPKSKVMQAVPYRPLEDIGFSSSGLLNPNFYPIPFAQNISLPFSSTLPSNTPQTEMTDDALQRAIHYLKLPSLSSRSVIPTNNSMQDDGTERSAWNDSSVAEMTSKTKPAPPGDDYTWQMQRETNNVESVENKQAALQTLLNLGDMELLNLFQIFKTVFAAQTTTNNLETYQGAGANGITDATKYVRLPDWVKCPVIKFLLLVIFRLLPFMPNYETILRLLALNPELQSTIPISSATSNGGVTNDPQMHMEKQIQDYLMLMTSLQSFRDIFDDLSMPRVTGVASQAEKTAYDTKKNPWSFNPSSVTVDREYLPSENNEPDRKPLQDGHPAASENAEPSESSISSDSSQSSESSTTDLFPGMATVREITDHNVDSRGDSVGTEAMDHVASSGNADEALNKNSMKFDATYMSNELDILSSLNSFIMKMNDYDRRPPEDTDNESAIFHLIRNVNKSEAHMAADTTELVHPKPDDRSDTDVVNYAPHLPKKGRPSAESLQDTYVAKKSAFENESGHNFDAGSEGKAIVGLQDRQSVSTVENNAKTSEEILAIGNELSDAEASSITELPISDENSADGAPQASSSIEPELDEYRDTVEEKEPTAMETAENSNETNSETEMTVMNYELNFDENLVGEDEAPELTARAVALEDNHTLLSANRIGADRTSDSPEDDDIA